MIVTHLDKSTCSHSAALWCGRYAPGEPSTKWAPNADCVGCLHAALAQAERDRDHYLNEMGSARAKVESYSEALGDRISGASAAAMVEAGREQIRRGMRGEQMDKRPLARVVALAGMMVHDARKREEAKT